MKRVRGFDWENRRKYTVGRFRHRWEDGITMDFEDAEW
jgi:hypothetical protein